MSKIQLLDQDTINKIAAGEVVERPASVVKELVENAIDAEATAITVEIKDGGLETIRITDNGTGIAAEEIRNAFLRHSTSKIRDVEDLFHINSLGFRGEALASIASVAQVEVITKTYQQLTGIRYQLEGGFEKNFEEIGCPEGTTFIINHLFFNTPARRKFLKSPVTEASYIAELMNKLALGNPHVSFKFINNGQVKLHTSGNNRQLDCIFTVFGKEITKNLIEINHEDSRMQISGYIGKPVISRANRNFENYFLNGRYIKSKVIQKAIEDAYKTKLTVHQYPFTVFHINMDPETVDINVHPTKMEVRFHDEKYVYDSLYNAIYEALNRNELIPQVSFDIKKPEDKPIFRRDIPEPFEKNRMQSDEYSTPSFDGRIGQVKESAVANQAVPGREVAFGRETALGKEVAFTSETDIPVTISQDENVLKTNDTIGQEKQDASKFAINEYQSTITNEEKIHEINEHQINDIHEQLNNKVDQQAYDNSHNQIEGLNNQSTQELRETQIQPPLQGEQIDYKEALFTDAASVKEHKIVGQLFNTYWIVEFKDKYYIIDQHAAHERILYDKIIDGLKEHKTASQVLVQPLIVQLSMKERLRYDAHQELFSELGFDIEDFGGDALAIRAVPLIFEKPIKPEDFISILDRLEDEYKEEKYSHLLEEIASMACKAAVKGHDKMSILEYEALIDELLKLENPFNCPHGRPTIISMTRYELEKKFKRIQ